MTYTNLKTTKLNFPKITRVILEDFSLFTSSNKIEVFIKDGVFCLAGANGLGKSTFLAAINFALTGMVSDPSRLFDSAEEYYRVSKNYALEYFNGRISENQRESAQITLHFHIGSIDYQITRGIFEPEELRFFSIIDKASGVSLLASSDLSPEDLHEAYAKSVYTHVGLANFPQFAFLQHFVFTFDESRRLLFWEQKALELAMYLCFGLDYDEAHRAESLRRDAEKAGSLARNNNWQASEVRKRIQSLLSEAQKPGITDSKMEDLVDQHKQFQQKYDEIEQEIKTRKDKLQDNALKISELSAYQLSLRTAYADAFESHLHSKFHISQHPLILETIKDGRCALCGARSENIANRINAHLHNSRCPLCDEKLAESTLNGEAINRLKKIDGEMIKATKNLELHVQTNQRLKNEIAQLQNEFEMAINNLRAFELENEKLLDYIKNKSATEVGIDSIVESYKRQLEEFLIKKEGYYQKRDEKLKELSKIKKKLESQYSSAEAEFVPTFKKLAVLFLGLDLDIRIDSQSSTGLTLVADVNGASRRKHHELSESQRFFIDIALRMALAQYVSADSAKAVLFIDTPEGSLDIAYESRAGLMLAKFVESGHCILMTANINTSKLLISLAKECTASRMQLVRMTKWTQLSEVQIAEEALFEEAFSKIEETLQGNALSD